ncbi:hypothetical protein TNCV_1908561 [Trichonephila clavipes]|nr:hypothetical protein TNCV_1908561 [Trichonephila clavipes]
MTLELASPLFQLPRHANGRMFEPRQISVHRLPTRKPSAVLGMTARHAGHPNHSATTATTLGEKLSGDSFVLKAFIWKDFRRDYGHTRGIKLLNAEC